VEMVRQPEESFSVTANEVKGILANCKEAL
jgi:hypothetical protein